MIVDTLEDANVARWRADVIQVVSDKPEDIPPYQVTRRCTKNDYVDSMHVYSIPRAQPPEAQGGELVAAAAGGRL